MRKYWTTEEINILYERYPNEDTENLVVLLGRKRQSIFSKANALGINKTPEFRKALQQKQMKELRNKGLAHEYKKGNVPFYKGKKLPSEIREKFKHTYFAKGSIPHNAKYDGYERLNTSGYWEVRVSKGVFKFKHRLLWEAHHGKIPKGHIVIFIDGNKDNVTIENLKLISRAESMLQNSVHDIPPEVIPSLVLKNKLQKLIKEKSK